MSILVDQLLNETQRCHEMVDNRWYFAKPMPHWTVQFFFCSLRDAWRVFRGKSFAVHYKADE